MNTVVAQPLGVPESAPRPTLLIVDDSRVMRVSLKKILKNDFELVEAVDGEDAWEKLQESPGIAGIFSDLSMPHLDGYGLLERVRNSEESRIRGLPFIVITGKEGELSELLEEVHAKGANDLVSKPFKTDDIVSRTKAFLAGNENMAAEAEAKRRAEEQARQAAEAEAEAKRRAEEQARQAAEAEAKRRAEEQARQAAEAEAKRRAEEEARQAAEAEAKRRAEEDSSQTAGEPLRVAPQSEQPEVGDEDSEFSDEDEARLAALRDKAREQAEIRQQQLQQDRQFKGLQVVLVRLVLPLLSLSNWLLKLDIDQQIQRMKERLPK